MIALRPATLADAEALGELAAAMVHFHQALDPDRYLRMPEPIAPGYGRFLATVSEDPRAVVLVGTLRDSPSDPERVVGYAYGHMEPMSYPELLDACGKLHDLYVDPIARRRGLARALVTAAIGRLEALGAPRVVLLSAWQNETAQALFTSLGFRKTMVEMTREAGGAGSVADEARSASPYQKK
jgi:ribosomal protein S18 acetylase RimI-like enzyme